MKIGLVYPFSFPIKTYYSNDARLRQFFISNTSVPVFFHPSLALLTIAALTPQTATLSLIDERVGRVTFGEGLDVAAITIMTAQAKRGYEIATGFRKRGVYTVLGGIHATVCREEAMNYCDTLIAGEAENTWPQFLADLAAGRAKKIYCEENEVDINRSPVPMYRLVDQSQFRLLPIQTTRGCPHDCNFCSVKTVFGPRFRVKDTAVILRELAAIQEISQNNRCVFNDDNMFVNKTRARGLLKAMEPLKIKYFAQTDISIAEDETFLAALRDSGCATVFIGFESLVPENLASIQKSGWKLKQSQTYAEKCRKIQSYGIQVFGSFLVGLDYDSRKSLLELADFVLENRIWAQFLFPTPFPGTRMREELIAQGRLPPDDDRWELYTCFDPIIKPRNMGMAELMATVLEIYEMVYSDSASKDRQRHMINRIKKA